MIILGKSSVRVNAQTCCLGIWAPSPECVIKGNVNQKGACIYNLPGKDQHGKRSWSAVVLQRSQAEAAGWRLAGR
jgi:hypothetical protein